MNDKNLVTLEMSKIELKRVAYCLGRLGAEKISVQIRKDIKDLSERVAASNIAAGEIIIKVGRINHNISNEVVNLFRAAYNRGFYSGVVDYSDLKAEDLEKRLNEEDF